VAQVHSCDYRNAAALPPSVYAPPWTPPAEPAELDLADVGAVVWATGFTPDWSFARLPIFDGTGYPVHRRGVIGVAGAYVAGLAWLWTWGSGRFLSVGRDAEFLVAHEMRRLAATAEAA
jgi:putative flavoprotein involved in K+ transport